MTRREIVFIVLLLAAAGAYAVRRVVLHAHEAARLLRAADGVDAVYVADEGGGGEPLKLGFLGDSLTSSATEDGPVAVMAARMLARELKRPVEVSRYAVPATTTCDWAPGVDGRIQGGLLDAAIGRFRSRGVTIVCVMLGTNDAFLEASDRRRYEADLAAIAAALKEAGFEVIVNEPPYARAAPGMAGLLSEYRAADEDLAAKGVIRLGEREAYALFRDRPAELSADGVHPDDQGYRELAELCAGGIARNLNREDAKSEKKPAGPSPFASFAPSR